MEVAKVHDIDNIQLASPELVKRAKLVANVVCLTVGIFSLALIFYWAVECTVFWQCLTTRTGSLLRSVMANLCLSSSFFLLLKPNKRFSTQLVFPLSIFALAIGLSSFLYPDQTNWLLGLNAIGIIFLSLSLLFFDIKSELFRHASQVTALAALAVGSVALSLYYFDSEQSLLPFEFSNAIKLSLSNSICIWGLSIAALLARPRNGMMVLMTNTTSSGRFARYTLYSILLVPFLFGILLSIVDKFTPIGLESKAGLFTIVVMVPVTVVFYFFAQLIEKEEIQNLKKELQLYKALGQVEGLFLNVADAILIVDENGIIQLANPGLCNLYGHKEEELIGRSVDILVPKERLEKFKKFKKEYTIHPTQVMLGRDFDYQGLRKDGSIFPIEVTLSPIDYNGKVHAVAVIRDTSSHLLVQQNLQQELKLLKLTEHETQVANQEDCPIGVASSMLEDVSKYYDWQLAQMLVLNQSCDQFEFVDNYYLQPELESQIQWPWGISDSELELLNRLREKGEILWQTDIDHSSISSWHHLSKVAAIKSALLVPVRASGKVVAVLEFFCQHLIEKNEEIEGVLQIVSTQLGKTFERKLEREQAKRALKAREETLARVSHDLQNPLATILASADVINVLSQRLENINEFTQFVVLIKKSVNVMQTFIRDLLDFSKMESRNYQLSFTSFAAEDLLQEVFDLLAISATNKSIQLKLVRDDSTQTNLQADRKLILRAILNLLNNAIKFSVSNAQVELGVYRDGDSVTFFVRDQGPGIPKEHQQKIFASYWQETSDCTNGSGLGLAIAKEIAEAHGGQISLESEYRVGSCFYLSLPLAPSSAKPVS